MKISTAIQIALLTAMIATPALARELTADETAALAQAVTDFNTAMGEADYATVVKTIPPAVVENIAASGGISASELITTIVSQMEEAMAAVKIESFSMDMAAVKYEETPDGTPYALIPTTTVVDAGAGGKFKAMSDTLALLDDDTWYLMSLSDPAQVGILSQVYPSFTGVQFPPGTMEQVTP